jgi:arginyl-tRNA synthetase
LLGKDIVQTGLETRSIFPKEDGSVWIDLTADGLDEKLVLSGKMALRFTSHRISAWHLQKYEEYHIDQQYLCDRLMNRIIT